MPPSPGLRFDVGGQGLQTLNAFVGDPLRGPGGGLTGQDAQDGEAVDHVLGAHADHRDSTAWGDLDQALERELQQCFAHRGAAGGEFLGDRVEVEPGAGGQRAGEDAVAQLARGALADRAGDINAVVAGHGGWRGP